jgi:nucleoid-associated protein YgaU
VATPEPSNAPPATAEPTSAPTSTPALAGEFIEYTVQRGDELLQLAKKYNFSTKEFMANNEIPNPDSLVVGQVLRIPKK